MVVSTALDLVMRGGPHPGADGKRMSGSSLGALQGWNRVGEGGEGEGSLDSSKQRSPTSRGGAGGRPGHREQGGGQAAPQCPGPGLLSLQVTE